MTKTSKVLSAIALLAIGFVLGAAILSRVSSQQNPLGAIVNDVSYLVGDVYQGPTQVLEFRNGYFVGNVSTTATSSFYGALSAASIKWDSNGGNAHLTIPTSTTNKVLAGSDVCGNAYITWTPGNNSSTITIPSSTAMTCLQEVGSAKVLRIQNASSAATSRIYLFNGDASNTLRYSGTSTATFGFGTSSLGIVGNSTLYLNIWRVTSSSFQTEVDAQIYQ